jgi:ABC-type phosphate/phosphonate transport system substrate-binding protein
MKYLLNTLVVMVMLFAFGCQNAESQSKDDVHFGEKISEDGAKSVTEVLAMLENEEEVQTKVKGSVESVCQAKGCWMNVKADLKDEVGFFVKFQDYGFFVPKDLAGGQVVMEGKAYKEITTVDELRHYAEDEGASEAEIAAITEPKEEYKFMATGVKIIK